MPGGSGIAQQMDGAVIWTENLGCLDRETACPSGHESIKKKSRSLRKVADQIITTAIAAEAMRSAVSRPSLFQGSVAFLRAAAAFLTACMVLDIIEGAYIRSQLLVRKDVAEFCDQRSRSAISVRRDHMILTYHVIMIIGLSRTGMSVFGFLLCVHQLEIRQIVRAIVLEILL